LSLMATSKRRFRRSPLKLLLAAASFQVTLLSPLPLQSDILWTTPPIYPIDWIEADDLEEMLIEPALPGWSDAFASPPGSRFPIRLQARGRIDRRFGPGSRVDENRYDGSPYGIVQRYKATHPNWSAGATLDKDKYEPRFDDLSRFYLDYDRESLHIIAGDFHTSSGLGLAVGKIPAYFSLFPSSPLYRKPSPTLSPASGTRLNKSFRGVGVRGEFGAWEVLLFTSKTPYDAIVTPDGRIERLSDGGLHRTPGEARKRDSVVESAVGGAIEWRERIARDLSLNAGLSGWQGKYKPPFEPMPNVRYPYPLAGRNAGAAGLSLGFEAGITGLFGEIASDRNRTRARCITLNRKRDGDIPSLHLIAFDLPPEYRNPAGASPIGDQASNLQGVAASLHRSFRKSRFDGRLFKLSKLALYLEATHRPARTVTVPEPHSESKASLEGEFAYNPIHSGRLRLRHQRDVIGHGEAGAIERADVSRVRYLHRTDYGSHYGHAFIAGLETGYRSPSTTGRQTGWLGLIRYEDETSTERLGLPGSSTLSLTGSWFDTPAALPIYLSESGLPDRMRVVRLSGRGMRWSVSLVGQSGRSWFGLMAAQTYLNAVDKGDLEGYISYSYAIDI